jgi:dihydroorotate dehydrogenase electron transfer subunit
VGKECGMQWNQLQDTCLKMQLYYSATIQEYRQFEHLIWIRLVAPSLARTARPGQFAMISQRQTYSLDPLLWSAIFLAGADPTDGTVELLIDPRDSTRSWLLDLREGTILDLGVPSVNTCAINPTTQTLLLAGVGNTLPALLFLARRYAGKLNVSLLMAGDDGFVPPPFLLPATVEVQISSTGESALFDLLTTMDQNPLRWADQIVLGLPSLFVNRAANLIRTTRLRWDHGLVQVILDGSLPCGLGICRVCQIETRQGWQRRCVEGPVFDLRDLRLPA